MQYYKSTTTAAAVLMGLLAVFTLAFNSLADHPRTVKLAAGSIDGLAAAIMQAGPGGTVLVKRGIHTEAGTTVIGIPIEIVGESGAVIACGTAPSPLLYPVSPAHIIPTLHVKGTHDVTVRGLQFVPVGAAANCAAFIQNADSVEVSDNHISGFQFGVMVHHGERAIISNNTVECAPLWAADPQYAFVVVGIDVFNGQFARLTENRVSGGFSGIFGNDRYGRMAHNSVTGCYIGYQMCHALYGILDVAGSGELVGADVPCTAWHIENNTATGNVLCGYLVIDGANHNVLVNNAGSANPLDIILTGDGDFFGVGIPMPASHDNLVVQGSHKGFTVMDCGVNNTIRGDVTLVPCP